MCVDERRRLMRVWLDWTNDSLDLLKGSNEPRPPLDAEALSRLRAMICEELRESAAVDGFALPDHRN